MNDAYFREIGNTSSPLKCVCLEMAYAYAQAEKLAQESRDREDPNTPCTEAHSLNFAVSDGASRLSHKYA